MILRNLRRTLPWLLLLGVAGGVAVSLLGTHAFHLDLFRGEISPGFLVLAVVLAFFPWFADSLRLRLWASVVGATLSGASALRVVVGTELGSAATPTAVGGLPVKVALLAESGLPAQRGFALALLKSLEDAVFFLLALPLVLLFLGPARPAHLNELAASWSGWVRGSLFESGWPVLGAAALGLVLVGLVVGAVARRRRAGGGGRRLRRWVEGRRRFRDFHATWSLMAGAPRPLAALSFGLTALQWGARYSALTALVWGLGIPVDPLLFWLLQWVVFTSMTLVPTPGGSGGAEVIFALVYGPLLPPTAVGWLVLGWRTLTFHLLLVAGSAVFALLQWRASTDHLPRAGRGTGPRKRQCGVAEVR